MTSKRNLSPNGDWAMSRVPKKVTGPQPRYLTLVTPRGRSMQNALDSSASLTLAEAMNVQHIDREIAFESMTVRFSRIDAAATVPLQIELALRGMPFAIAEQGHFAESELYRAARRAWESDSSADVLERDVPLIDALADVLERLTSSDDSWVWLDRLDSLEDGDLGSDSAGVQFVPQ